MATDPSRKVRTPGPHQEELRAVSGGAWTWGPTPCPHLPPGGHHPPEEAPRSHLCGPGPQWMGQAALQPVLKRGEMGVGSGRAQGLTECTEYTDLTRAAPTAPGPSPGTSNPIPGAATYPGCPHPHHPPATAGPDALAVSGSSGVSWGEREAARGPKVLETSP